MQFISFRMNDDVRREYLDAGHELLLFGRTREHAPDGTVLCVLVGSSNHYQSLAVVAAEHARKDTEKLIAHYFIYNVQAIEQGLVLGEQELKAKEN